MEKGFSLVELLVVITILAIIALISVPTINNVINKSREKAYEQQEKAIVDAAKTYIANHSTELPSKTTYKCKTVKELQTAGLISNKKASGTGENYKTGIVNPAKNISMKKTETDDEFNGAVKIIYDGHKYFYTYTNNPDCTQEDMFFFFYFKI